VMWQAARRVAKEKPVLISVGGMAASGGYYVVSAGERIFAEPSSIVGSIGVVGGKFVTHDLFDKLGLATETFSKGRNADLFSSSKPFDERQRKMVTQWMKQTYDQFTSRVMTTRGKKIKDIDDVARGRIFAAKQGKELGLVDEIGGLQTSINYAADKVDLKDGDYDVRILPAAKTIADYFYGSADAKSPVQPKVSIDLTSLFAPLDGRSRQLLTQQLQSLQLLQRRPVVLIAPYVVSLR